MLDNAHVWKISQKMEEKKYLNLTHTSKQMF